MSKSMSPDGKETFLNNISKVEEYLCSSRDRVYYFIYKFLITYPIYLNDLLETKVEDYHYELGNDYIIVSGNEYPIPESISLDMKNYVFLQAPDSYLFVTQRGNRIYSPAFSRLLGDVSKKYNLSDLNCSELRKIALQNQSIITRHQTSKDIKPIQMQKEDEGTQNAEIGYWRGDLKLSEMGERIREVRKQQNLTRSQLALYTNISPHYLYEIEKGNKAPSVTILYRIAKVLGVSTDYLLMESKNTENDELDKLLEKLSAKSRENLSAILIELLNLTREGRL